MRKNDWHLYPGKEVNTREVGASSAWMEISSEKRFVQTRTKVYFWRTTVTIDLIIVVLQLSNQLFFCPPEMDFCPGLDKILFSHEVPSILFPSTRAASFLFSIHLR
jgi:hypothetical protein